MRIASVETIPIRVPLVRPFHGSHYHMTHRSTIVVRITTDDGIVGEAYAGDEDASLLEIDRIVNDELAPKLVGEDAYAIERCWELCRPATFDILRDRRIGLVAGREQPILFGSKINGRIGRTNVGGLVTRTRDARQAQFGLKVTF